MLPAADNWLAEIDEVLEKQGPTTHKPTKTLQKKEFGDDGGSDDVYDAEDSKPPQPQKKPK